MNTHFLQNVGFILTTGLSLILSVLLFTSVADSRLSWLLLAAIALSLELGKILFIKNKNPLVAGLLIAVSVMGSAGGLSSAIAVTDAGIDDRQQQRQLILDRIDQTRRTLEQNNQAIERYIELDQIKVDALPLQAQNRALNAELIELNHQLTRLEPGDVPELVAVLNLLSTLLLMPVEWVRSLVVLLLACLLDTLTFSFIRDGVLQVRSEEGEPEPEDRQPRPEQGSQPEAPQSPVLSSPSSSANVTAMDDSYPAFKRMMVSRRDAGQEVLAQRACIRELNLKDRQVRGFFQRLQDEGVIEKGVRGQFVFARSEPRQVSFSVI